MRFCEQLRRRLSEAANLVLECLPHYRVRYRVKVDVTLVRQVVENVSRAHSLRATLSVAEYQVNPLV